MAGHARHRCFAILGAILSLAIHLAPARAAMMIEFVASGLTIVDNGPGDLSRADHIIKFDVIPPGAGYRARGTLTQMMPTALTPFSLVLTDTVISQVGTGGSSDVIRFTSSVVNPFFPATLLSAHLDGHYIKVDAAGDPIPGGMINQADIRFDAYAGRPGAEDGFGSIRPPGVVGVPAPVAFGPSDTSSLQTFQTNIDLRGDLLFLVASSDGIFLPTSASISASRGVVPEPSTLLIMSFGLAGLIGFSAGCRPASTRPCC
jgi:hypothetical protein